MTKTDQAVDLRKVIEDALVTQGATFEQLAAQAGVTTPTVLRAYRGAGVTDQTRTKILEALA